MITAMVICAFASGILLGGCAVWIWTVSRRQSGYARIEGRASAAEAVAGELRQRLTAVEQEAERLRAEIGLERGSRIEAAARLEASQKSLDHERQALDAVKREMTDTFTALSSTALKSSSEDFIRLASEHMGRILETTKGRLGEHQAAMDGMIKPLHETLKRYEDQIKTMEEGRHKAYGSLEEQLRTLASTNENLQKETNNLVTALRKPQVRGRWGEMQLKRVAELSGMSM